MKYQKNLVNILLVYFLFFTLSTQAENNLNTNIQESNNNTQSFLLDNMPSFATGGSAFNSLDMERNYAHWMEQATKKLKKAKKLKKNLKLNRQLISSLKRNGARGLKKANSYSGNTGPRVLSSIDKTMTNYSIVKNLYNLDVWGAIDVYVDDQASTYLAELAISTSGVAGPKAVVLGGIVAGTYGYVKKHVYDHIKYEYFTVDSEKALLKAQKSFDKCNIPETLKQTNIALTLVNKSLKKSNAECKEKKYEVSRLLKKQKKLNTYKVRTELDNAIDMKNIYCSRIDAPLKRKGIIESLTQTASTLKTTLSELRVKYRDQLNNTREKADLTSKCESFAPLKETLNKVSNNCQLIILSSYEPSLERQTRDIMMNFGSDTQHLLSDREKTLDKIREDFGACSNLNNIEQQLLVFEDEIQKNKICYIDDDWISKFTIDKKLLDTLNDVKNEFYAKKNKCEAERIADNLQKNEDDNTSKNTVLNQIVYRIEGGGFTPHYGGKSYEKVGYRDVVYELSEPATETYIQSIIDKVYDQYKRNPCDLKHIPIVPGYKMSPEIWKNGPKVTIIKGPTSGLSSDESVNGWEIKSSDGPSFSKLKGATGCKQ